MKQVAVYSGTFDPIHSGHEWLIEYCLNERKFDEVIVLVEPTPRNKADAARFSHRIAMVRLRYADEPRVSVNPFEDHADTFTLKDTLPKICEYAAVTDITLVMGGDVFEYVPRWSDLHSVLASLSFVVALRYEDDGEIVVGLLRNELTGANVHMVTSPHPNISSSKVRAQLADGGTSDLVDTSVAAYAHDNELYT